MEGIPEKRLICRNGLLLLNYLISHKQHVERNTAVFQLRIDCQGVLEDSDRRQSLTQRTQIDGRARVQSCHQIFEHLQKRIRLPIRVLDLIRSQYLSIEKKNELIGFLLLYQ